MAQSVVEVLRMWETTTGMTLPAPHRAAFRARAEVVSLAALPRRAAERAANSVHRQAGELRLSAWLSAAEVQRVSGPLLRIEMVPSTCWWSNLRSELADEQWGVCKRWSTQRAGCRCEIAGERGSRWPVECHEQWSYADGEGPRTQRLDGLISLCPACHKSTHMRLAGVRGRLEEAMGHLIDVNGWSRHQGESYLE